MRWLGLVAALALVACGGADDGEVFGGADAGPAVHYGPSGLPDCDVTCGEDHQARCEAPGRTKADLDGRYAVKEAVPHGKYEPILKVLTPAYEDGAVVAYCHNPGDAVTFRSN